ncbi:MAG TPA: LamG domain-containing protein [Candidatus Desulfofervidus auxilii]|uniref:LamG domain-containing protein n=1 Tax=Desulfofervidus auxilii TaxID=1621989 RepID=A0A7C0U1Q2_DESA2|nr:LamG domain-containing protein [Candidatus Desulfofervidus auxilii]
MAEYNRQSVKRPLEHNWEQAKTTIERTFPLLDKEHEKIQSAIASNNTNISTLSERVPAPSVTQTNDVYGYFYIGDILVQYGSKTSSTSGDVTATLAQSYKNKNIAVIGNAEDSSGSGNYNVSIYPPSPSDNCIIWNKLGSDAEVTNSEIGADFSWTGTSAYKEGKFGNGIYTNNYQNYVTASGADFTPNNFTVEMWIKTDFNVTNGQVDNGHKNTLFVWYYNSDNRMYWSFHDNSNALGFGIYVSGNITFYSTSNINFNAGELHHVAFVFDRAGIGGTSDIAKMYFDGEEIYSSTSAPASQSNTGGTIYLTSLQGNSIWYYEGVIDNIKIWNYAKTDFSDRNTESMETCVNNLKIGCYQADTGSRVAKTVRFITIGEKA